MPTQGESDKGGMSECVRAGWHRPGHGFAGGSAGGRSQKPPPLARFDGLAVTMARGWRPGLFRGPSGRFYTLVCVWRKTRFLRLLFFHSSSFSAFAWLSPLLPSYLDSSIFFSPIFSSRLVVPTLPSPPHSHPLIFLTLIRLCRSANLRSLAQRPPRRGLNGARCQQERRRRGKCAGDMTLRLSTGERGRVVSAGGTVPWVGRGRWMGGAVYTSNWGCGSRVGMSLVFIL